MTTLPADALVERLRACEPFRDECPCLEAADLIEAQAAEISSLRAKLAEAMEVVRVVANPQATVAGEIARSSIEHVRAARRLIEGNGNG